MPRCNYTMTYSFDPCEQNATHSLEWLLGEGDQLQYHCEPMCSYHAYHEAELIKGAGGLAEVTEGID